VYRACASLVTMKRRRARLRACGLDEPLRVVHRKHGGDAAERMFPYKAPPASPRPSVRHLDVTFLGSVNPSRARRTNPDQTSSGISSNFSLMSDVTCKSSAHFQDPF
jgi:hypothetical protein